MTLRLPIHVLDNLLLPPRISTWDWIRQHVVLRDGARSYPFNAIDYPYHKGICDAADDPLVQELVFVAGTQVGKSTVSRAWLVSRLGTDPSNAIFASSIEKLARGTARDELWPMLRACDVTRPWCPHNEKDEATDTMRLTNLAVRIGWSGSPTTLGDWTARWGLGGEYDKWTHAKSEEADPGALFDKRFGAVNDYQWFKEGTPTYLETSRLWRLLLGGSNCRLHVPCPFCKGHQELILGNGKPGTGGIVWTKGKGGPDPLRALKTARYRCAKCGKTWGDEYRMPAVRKGVWVPEGCFVNDKTGKVEGEALRPWPRASFQISRLYSPRTTWGKLAREYVECGNNPELLRDYWNSTLGLPWEQRRKRGTWEEVAERTCGDHEIGICPEGSIFVTVGVDVQLAHVVYLISAWGQRARGWCLGVGTAASFSELRENVLDVQWEHADGGDPLPVEMALVDSRYREDEVFEFTESISQLGRLVWPYKGAKAGQLQNRPYRKLDPRDPDAQGRLSRSQKLDDFFQITGNTNWWQSWADRCLYTLKPGDDSAYSFYAGARADEDLFTQLTNEVFEPNSAPPRWEKITGSAKVDFRDCFRMARTAAEVNVAGAWSRLAPRVSVRTQPAPAAAGRKVEAFGERDPWVRRPPPRRSARRRR